MGDLSKEAVALVMTSKSSQNVSRCLQVVFHEVVSNSMQHYLERVPHPQRPTFLSASSRYVHFLKLYTSHKQFKMDQHFLNKFI